MTGANPAFLLATAYEVVDSDNFDLAGGVTTFITAIAIVEYLASASLHTAGVVLVFLEFFLEH